MFARDPDAILDLRELKVDGLTDKYRAEHEEASEVLTGWEMNGTLREFAPMPPRRMWFDYPIHVPDDQNFLGIATYNESGKGVGKDQKTRTDWLETVEEMLSISLDSAVTLEAVGISEGNAKKQFGSGTKYEVATVDGTKVVHNRFEDQIDFNGMTYLRKNHGRGYTWIPSSK